MPLRSYLFAPGHRAELVRKVFDAGADAVVLDLEDAVPPGEKTRAREVVSEALARRVGERGPEAWVRINALDGDLWRGDVAAVVGSGLVGLRIAKTESVASLAELESTLAAAEAGAGLERDSVRLSCTIESAVGLLAARELAAQRRVAQLTFGAADFAADIGADPTAPEATLWARSYLVVACRAAGIGAPVAPVYTDLADDEGLARSTEQARRLGFFGRSCIHPKQLPAIHAAFTPTTEECRAAEEVIARASLGGGTTTGDGRFVDPAVVRHARAVLELAARVGLREGTAR